QVAELLACAPMRLRCAVHELRFVDRLTCIRCGLGGKALLRRRLLARQGARRILPILNREQRLARQTLEQENKTLLAGLSDGVDGFAMAFYTQEYRRRREMAVP